jgi:hypothetical protein
MRPPSPPKDGVVVFSLPFDKFQQNISPMLCKIQPSSLHLVFPLQGGANMDTIRKEYTLLFNAITDAETALEQLRQQLICAQQQAEELFLAADEAQEVHPAS